LRTSLQACADARHGCPAVAQIWWVDHRRLPPPSSPAASSISMSLISSNAYAPRGGFCAAAWLAVAVSPIFYARDHAGDVRDRCQLGCSPDGGTVSGSLVGVRRAGLLPQAINLAEHGFLDTPSCGAMSAAGGAP
jgi:hypothetical protein